MYLKYGGADFQILGMVVKLLLFSQDCRSSHYQGRPHDSWMCRTKAAICSKEESVSGL